MPFSLNKIMLLGNLGKDPEIRFTTTNVEVANFSVATSHSYKGKDGNWVNETTWHNIVAFNLSDFMKQNLRKGKKIYLEGRQTNRSYDDKQGVKRYVYEIIADTSSIIPLDAVQGQSSSSQQTEDYPAQNFNVDVAEDNNDLPF